MPTEITSEGVQKVSGLAKMVTTQKQIKVNVAGSVTLRQDLPPGIPPEPSFNAAQDDSISTETIESKVNKLNSRMQNLQRDLQFSIDSDSGRTIIRVIDSETRETIRTIPPEDISVLAQRMDKHSGVLFNTSV